jgi:hypothetical protein
MYTYFSIITFGKDECALLCAVCDSSVELTGSRGVDGDAVLSFDELSVIVSTEDEDRVDTCLWTDLLNGRARYTRTGILRMSDDAFLRWAHQVSKRNGHWMCGYEMQKIIHKDMDRWSVPDILLSHLATRQQRGHPIAARVIAKAGQKGRDRR